MLICLLLLCMWDVLGVDAIGTLVEDRGQLVESVLSFHLGSGGRTQAGRCVWQGFYLVSHLTDPANQFLCGVKCQ